MALSLLEPVIGSWSCSELAFLSGGRYPSAEPVPWLSFAHGAGVVVACVPMERPCAPALLQPLCLLSFYKQNFPVHRQEGWRTHTQRTLPGWLSAEGGWLSSSPFDVVNP